MPTANSGRSPRRTKIMYDEEHAEPDIMHLVRALKGSPEVSPMHVSTLYAIVNMLQL